MRKRIAIFLFVLLCIGLAFLLREGIGLFWEQIKMLEWFETRFDLPDDLPTGDEAFVPACDTATLQHRHHYLLSYSEKERLAHWVAYELTPDELIKTTDRSNYRFVRDTALKNGVDHNAYKKSGYDRGHLAPAGDMAFSEIAMEESFRMSNIAPQLPAFNQGIWNHLENWVRDWVRKEGAVYVVTGNYYNNRSKRMAGCDIPIPDYYYKIVFDAHKSSKGMIVFLFPHTNARGSIFDYTVTVDSLESLTAIDFFPQLPDSLESTLESVVRKSLWRR